MSYIKNSKLSILSIILLSFMIAPVWIDHFVTEPTQRQLAGSDIFFIWQDGEDIAAGKNPYSRIHGSDMIHNEKYSTYLPGFFLLEVLLIKSGVKSFEQFFPIWRFAVTLIYSLIGLALFESIRKRTDSTALALFSAFFWLLGRWSFSSLRIWQIDFIAIAFLLAALLLLETRSILAFVLLGVSLSIKQIAVFIVPLFLIWAYLNKTTKQQILQLAALLSVPALVSLPFIAWDAVAYFQSLFFSLTRNPGGLKLETIDQVFGIVGLAAKIPLLSALILVYLLFFRSRISIAQAMLLAFLSFVTFNSVLFKQYLPWVSVFVGLAAADFVKFAGKRELSN